MRLQQFDDAVFRSSILHGTCFIGLAMTPRIVLYHTQQVRCFDCLSPTVYVVNSGSCRKVFRVDLPTHLGWALPLDRHKHCQSDASSMPKSSVHEFGNGFLQSVVTAATIGVPHTLRETRGRGVRTHLRCTPVTSQYPPRHHST